MNLNLSTALTELIQHKVDSGRYNSAGEVVREALQLLAERDELMDLRNQDLRKKIAQGLGSLRRGEGIDGGEFFELLEREETDIERRLQPA